MPILTINGNQTEVQQKVFDGLLTLRHSGMNWPSSSRPTALPTRSAQTETTGPSSLTPIRAWSNTLRLCSRATSHPLDR
jgi:hypothetical protein